MNYQLLQPPAYLKEHVQYFWTLESDHAVKLPSLNPLADGNPGLIFHQSAASNFISSEKGELPSLFLYGQTIKPTQLQLEGKFKSIGVCFTPHALNTIFRMDAHELTDTCLNVNDLNSELRLTERLLNAATTQQQLDILYQYLLSQISKQNLQPEASTSGALDRILKSKGLIALKDLQQEFKLSERTFERRFTRQIGISPKLFSRVTQFQTALNQLKSGQFTRLSDIAFDSGYTDQSHFTRSFKEFTGFTPFQFQKNTAQLSGAPAVLAD